MKLNPVIKAVYELESQLGHSIDELDKDDSRIQDIIRMERKQNYIDNFKKDHTELASRIAKYLEHDIKVVKIANHLGMSCFEVRKIIIKNNLIKTYLVIEDVIQNRRIAFENIACLMRAVKKYGIKFSYASADSYLDSNRLYKGRFKLYSLEAKEVKTLMNRWLIKRLGDAYEKEHQELCWRFNNGLS